MSFAFKRQRHGVKISFDILAVGLNSEQVVTKVKKHLAVTKILSAKCVDKQNLTDNKSTNWPCLFQRSTSLNEAVY